MIPLTAERLRQIVDYCPATGRLIWRVRADQHQRWNSRHAGKVCGYGGLSRAGYHRVSIDNKRYLAHRLVWLYCHGCWPGPIVDHRNLIKTDNRIENLREATPLQSSANISVRKGSKFRGTIFVKKTKKWMARIAKAKKNYHLGTFATQEEAAAAYSVAARKMYGEFCPLEMKAAP